MTTFSTSREIPATVEQVFAAISDPDRLAMWWGPAGFTNTFHICEFENGGRWSFVMHGPDGQNYSNENVFSEIERPGKVVIQHISAPECADALMRWRFPFIRPVSLLLDRLRMRSKQKLRVER